MQTPLPSRCDSSPHSTYSIRENELYASNSAPCNAGQRVWGVASAMEDKPGFWVGRAPPPSKEHECRREYGLSAHECWVCMHTYTHRLAKMCGQALMAWSISRTSRLQTKTPAQPCSPPAPPCYSKALLQFPDSVLPCSQVYMVLSAPIQ